MPVGPTGETPVLRGFGELGREEPKQGAGSAAAIDFQERDAGF